MIVCRLYIRIKGNSSRGTNSVDPLIYAGGISRYIEGKHAGLFGRRIIGI